MKKLLLACLLGIFAWPATARAQAPLDYFEVGKFMDFTNFPEIWATFEPNEIPGQLKQGHDLFAKARATPGLLASYDVFAKQLSTLPLTKPYPAWTKDQKNVWSNANLDAGLRDQWLGEKSTPAYFYFWLGYESTYAGALSGPEATDWNSGDDTVRANVTEAVDKFAALATSPCMDQLSPRAQVAIVTLAGLKTRLGTSGKGLGHSDLLVLALQGKVIQDAGDSGSLLK